MDGASRRPRSLVCRAHFAFCVLARLTPRTPGHASVRRANASIDGVACRWRFVGPEQYLGALGLPEIDGVVKPSHVGLLDHLDPALLCGSHLHATADALDARFDCVA